MIKKTDLRIGNLVAYEGNIFRIKELRTDHAEIIKSDTGEIFTSVPYKELSGNSVSPEALVQLEWIREEGKSYYSFKGNRPTAIGGIPGFFDIDYPWNNSNEQARIWMSKDKSASDEPGYAVSFSFIHQLQNLAYVLSGVEI